MNVHRVHCQPGMWLYTTQSRQSKCINFNTSGHSGPIKGAFMCVQERSSHIHVRVCILQTPGRAGCATAAAGSCSVSPLPPRWELRIWPVAEGWGEEVPDLAHSEMCFGPEILGRLVHGAHEIRSGCLLRRGFFVVQFGIKRFRQYSMKSFINL